MGQLSAIDSIVKSQFSQLLTIKVFAEQTRIGDGRSKRKGGPWRSALCVRPRFISSQRDSFRFSDFVDFKMQWLLHEILTVSRCVRLCWWVRENGWGRWSSWKEATRPFKSMKILVLLTFFLRPLKWMGPHPSILLSGTECWWPYLEDWQAFICWVRTWYYLFSLSLDSSPSSLFSTLSLNHFLTHSTVMSIE